MLRRLLDHIAFLEDELEQLATQIEQRLAPYEHQLALITEVVGLRRTTSVAILAEIGNRQSGGKRQHASANKGNTHLRAALAEAVWAIAHTKDNYPSAQ